MTAAASPKRPRRATTRSTASQRRVNGAAEQAELRQILVDRIEIPGRPARRLLGDIVGLADSMQDYGLQQPISVRADGERFILTSGLRRLSAARMLRWTTITAFVRSVSADDAYLLDLVENLQRENLSAEEEADAFGELLRTRRWTVQQVADSVKRSVGYISKRVRVFEDPLLREAIARGELQVSTAEILLAASPEERRALVQRAIAEHWDQLQARDALRAPDAEADHATAADTGKPRRGRPSRAATAASATYPKGFTRMIREFHRILINVRAEDLTQSDRSALRALFQDLVLLARTPSTPGPRVFPPLPGNGQSASGTRRSTVRSSSGG